MKAKRIPPAPVLFNPVTLILETQAEVDALYAFFNHYQLCAAAGLTNDEGFEALLPYRDKLKCDALHIALCRLTNHK